MHSVCNCVLFFVWMRNIISVSLHKSARARIVAVIPPTTLVFVPIHRSEKEDVFDSFLLSFACSEEFVPPDVLGTSCEFVEPLDVDIFSEPQPANKMKFKQLLIIRTALINLCMSITISCGYCLFIGLPILIHSFFLYSRICSSITFLRIAFKECFCFPFSLVYSQTIFYWFIFHFLDCLLKFFSVVFLFKFLPFAVLVLWFSRFYTSIHAELIQIRETLVCISSNFSSFSVFYLPTSCGFASSSSIPKMKPHTAEAPVFLNA